MSRPAARLRWLWRVLRRSNQVDTDMRDEMRLHIDLEAERLEREQGLPRHEARRRAHVAFGGLEKFRQAGRETRGIQMIDAIALDARIGVRMLAKHRGLTLVGGFAMAVAIAVGATFFEVLSEMLDPALPLEDGRSIVAVQYGSGSGSPDRRLMREFLAWRDGLTTMPQLGAFRTVQHNLVSGNGTPEPIKVAEITASGFAIARVPPMMGRYLVPDDEREGAPAVVVIGHQAWTTRFGSDPYIVGRSVALGGVPSTVVGVMPDGFGFPVDHQFWSALRTGSVPSPSAGPEIFVFGRLAPGVSPEEAQAELIAATNQREGAARTATAEPLRPRVIPFTREHLDIADPGLVWFLRVAQLLVGALVFVVAVNLAILVYARTVTRIGEIAIRTALGASRRRIQGQLFVEAFALAVLGAAAGLLLTDVALARMQALATVNGGVPWWIDFDLSIATILYALALAAFAAVIIGVVPGLRATGANLSANLHELNGRTGTRLGPMWTTLVVAQVAVAVAVLPVSVYVAAQVMRMEVSGVGFDATNYAVGLIALADQTDGSSDAQRLRVRQLGMMTRLEAEPGVAAVTFSSGVPGFAGGREIEFERGAVAGDIETADVSSMGVAAGMFEVYGARVLAGRPFTARDTNASNVVVVNRTFAERFAPAGNVLGLQFRYRRVPQDTEQPKPYEIVGVVDDFPAFPPALSVDREPVVYHATEAGSVNPFTLTVKFDGAVPAGFLDRFRQVGAQVDPALQVRRIAALSTFYDQLRAFWRYIAWGATLLTAAVILLSAAGIYALMSFTVAQRTREIGIRAALGAAPHRLLISVFGRAARQLALGLVAGSLLSSTAFVVLSLDLASGAVLLLAVAGIMSFVGLLAAVGPARRGLRISASEALRAEG